MASTPLPYSPHPPSRSWTSWLTSAGFALPPLCRITWPTKKPSSPVLPARYSSALGGVSGDHLVTSADKALGSSPAKDRIHIRHERRADGRTHQWKLA